VRCVTNLDARGHPVTYRTVAYPTQLEQISRAA